MPAAALAVGSRPHAGWTIRIALPAGATPDWAYPYAPGAELTATNVDDFQQLMYRPLYFFGGSTQIAPSAALSLATPPVYGAGDTTVTFSIRPGLRWSDGEPVSAEGVVEWLNLLAAFPGMWGDYLAPLASGQPLGLPDDLRDVAVAGQQVTLTLAGAVNPTWFTDSELSQITPLPSTWDVYEPTRPHVPTAGPASIAGNGGDFTAPTAAAGCYSTHWIGDGNGGPSSTFVDPLGTRTVVVAADVPQAQRCVDAVELLRSVSSDTADYTTPGTDVAATFGIADGPWRLLDYHLARGVIVLAPNHATGAAGQRPTAVALDLVPCATGAACERLLAGSRVDQGVLPIADAPPVRSLTAAPASNPLRGAGYRETVLAPWATSYLPYNFLSTLGADGHAGTVFAQRYVRLALQSLVDQPAVVDEDLGGYGIATDAPIPAVPASVFATDVANPAPYSIGRAEAILAAHGWHVAPGHQTVCAVAVRCGAGIPKGTPLAFRVVFAQGAPSAAAAMSRLVRDAALAGVVLTARAVPLAQVIADVTGDRHSWDLASWGGGWRYAPDFYPSGEWTFAAGAPWNVGGYTDPRATALVLATTRSPAALPAYDRYLAADLPVVWQATPVTLVETRADLHGVVVSPTGALTPEAWRE